MDFTEIQAEIHKRIKRFVSSRNQGYVMGEIREVLTKAMRASDAPALTALLAAAPIAAEQIRECANGDCNWRGPVSETVQMKHGFPNMLCPKCHEVTEAAPTAAVDDGMHKALMTWEGPDTSGRDRWAFQQGFKAARASMSERKAVTLTDEMIDAARPLFLAMECGAKTIESVRSYFINSGHAIDRMPDWFKTGSGHLTKAGKAIVAWHAMNIATTASDSTEK